MELALLIAVAIVLVTYGREIHAHGKSQNASLEQIRTQLNEFRDKLSELADQIHDLSVTPEERKKRRFDRLPALTSDQFVDMPADWKLYLILEAFEGFCFVEYQHRELVHRTPDNKDAVAFGKARLKESDDFQDVRILFSKVHSTATIKGLAREGSVKFADRSKPF